MKTLNDRILKTIREALCSEYIGRFDIIKDEDSYTLKLDLNQHEAPLYFSYQGTEEEFLKALYKDLQVRQLDRTKYYKGVQTDPGNDAYSYITLDI